MGKQSILGWGQHLRGTGSSRGPELEMPARRVAMSPTTLDKPHRSTNQTFASGAQYLSCLHPMPRWYLPKQMDQFAERIITANHRQQLKNQKTVSRL